MLNISKERFMLKSGLVLAALLSLLQNGNLVFNAKRFFPVVVFVSVKKMSHPAIYVSLVNSISFK